jgi:hypothetical protein
MHPKFLFDENVSAILWAAVRPHNAYSSNIQIDAIRVGDLESLPLQSDDAAVLLWAEQHGCILVSHDKRTLPGHLATHLAAGHHIPGLFLFSYHTTVEEILELLAVAAASDSPLEWQDLIEYLG